VLIQPLGSRSGPAGHLHEPFLERAQRSDIDQRAALAGFLTLRLVDQFAAHRIPPHPDALAYQCNATSEFLREFDPPATEVNHLVEVVRLAQETKPSDVRLLWPPLMAYAYWLEQELRLDEALDVLDTVMRLDTEGVDEEVIACCLQRGRTLRQLGRFDDAQESYRTAGSLAEQRGDTHSELLSRIGRGIVLERLGNLPASEETLTSALEEARRIGDQDARARASHDLANTYGRMQRTADAVPLLYAAYQTYDERLKKLRALSDLGVIFKQLGRLGAAEDAFTVVASGDIPRDMRVTAALELIETSASKGDRLAFERWKRLAEPDVHTSPYLSVDYNLKVGLAFERFGNRERSLKCLERARELADQHGLHQYSFEAERCLHSIRDRESAANPQPPDHADAYRDDVSEVAEEVQRLRLAAQAG
jgi:tetratricopeptide (TPR) repeat protein